jgi:hypothetical protein
MTALENKQSLPRFSSHRRCQDQVFLSCADLTPPGTIVSAVAPRPAIRWAPSWPLLLHDHPFVLAPGASGRRRADRLNQKQRRSEIFFFFFVPSFPRSSPLQPRHSLSPLVQSHSTPSSYLPSVSTPPLPDPPTPNKAHSNGLSKGLPPSYDQEENIPPRASLSRAKAGHAHLPTPLPKGQPAEKQQQATESPTRRGHRRHPPPPHDLDRPRRVRAFCPASASERARPRTSPPPKRPPAERQLASSRESALLCRNVVVVVIGEAQAPQPRLAFPPPPT